MSKYIYNDKLKIEKTYDISVELLEFYDSYATSWEQNMWRAVITQALMDVRIQSKNNTRYGKRKRDAAKWLEGDSADFELVCEYANLHPEFVRKKAKEVMDGLKNGEYRSYRVK